MEILLKVDGLNLPELNEEDARNALFALAKHEYHNASTIEDAYISDGTIDAAEMNFGSKNRMLSSGVSMIGILISSAVTNWH